jgi:hypothetical protein
MSLPDLAFFRRLAGHPSDKVAIVDLRLGGREFAYGALLAHTVALCNRLQGGKGYGSRCGMYPHIDDVPQ